MRDLSKNFNYRQDHKAALYLQIFLMFLFALNIGLEYWFKSISFAKFVAYSISGFFFFKFYYESLKNLLYTFWGLTITLSITLGLFFIEALSSEYFAHHGTLNFLMVFTLCLIIYIASSPVYYPRVYWWEFEYRYRADFKVFTEQEEIINEARLKDIRRTGASLSSFENFDMASQITLKFEYLEDQYELQAIIGSVGQTIPGRPFIYGIKFMLLTSEEKKLYSQLESKWLNRKKIKIAEKFDSEERA